MNKSKYLFWFRISKEVLSRSALETNRSGEMSTLSLTMEKMSSKSYRWWQFLARYEFNLDFVAFLSWRDMLQTRDKYYEIKVMRAIYALLSVWDILLGYLLYIQV